METLWTKLWSHDGSRRFMGGGIIGLVCGFTFGAVDAANVVGLTGTKEPFTKSVARLGDPKVMRVFFAHQMRVTAGFGVMFAGYQVSRWGLEQSFPNMEEEVQTILSAGAGIAPVLPSRAMRRNLPWMLVLVGFDWWNGGVK